MSDLVTILIKVWRYQSREGAQQKKQKKKKKKKRQRLSLPLLVTFLSHLSPCARQGGCHRLVGLQALRADPTGPGAAPGGLPATIRRRPTRGQGGAGMMRMRMRMMMMMTIMFIKIR
jgi:hypothetical protein